MWKYLSYNIFGNCLPGKKVFILVFTQQAGNSEVSKILGICKKTVPLNQRMSIHNSVQRSINQRKTSP